MTGRVGSYDPLWSGRWAGDISGDRATASYAPCACGRLGPTIEDSVVRYSELSAAATTSSPAAGRSSST